MNSLNSIIVEGNVVRTPQIRETPKGTPVCSLSVAVSRWYKSNNGVLVKEVSFFDVDTWGNLAKVCSQTCEKGRGIRVVGRLKQNRWQDSDGKPRSRVCIVAEHVEFKPKFSGVADKTEQGVLNQALQDEDSLLDVTDEDAEADAVMALHQKTREVVF
jgi:single-strand DNA-binding protein